MELFFTNNISGSIATLDREESRHCVKVLRNKPGDIVSFIDGQGGMYKGEISAITGNECIIQITESIKDYMPMDYFLHMAVALTKNLDRYEWFLEKAAELGIDQITPLVGEHSERRVFKPERGERILLSAVKQSLKARIPILDQVTAVKEFILNADNFKGIKIIAHCNEGDRRSLVELLNVNNIANLNGNRFLILIGPEGDFSPAEVELALSHGFLPVTMGESRLRTETAALSAVIAVYFLRSRNLITF